MRLTVAAIEGLKLDTGVADKIIFDDDVPGFGIRLRASGARTGFISTRSEERPAGLSSDMPPRSSQPARGRLPASCTPRCAWAVIPPLKSERGYSRR